MQYTIESSAPQADLALLRRGLDEVDPAAMVDMDPASGQVRISTLIGAAELLTLVKAAGYPVGADALQQLPSQCCGGCGG
ncbi:MAG: hypothetical protein ABIO17_00875 [Pseudoxanthomonas sp.]